VAARPSPVNNATQHDRTDLNAFIRIEEIRLM
jgi:hypothetical protein